MLEMKNKNEGPQIFPMVEKQNGGYNMLDQFLVWNLIFNIYGIEITF